MLRISHKRVGTLPNLKKFGLRVVEKVWHLYCDRKITAVVRDLRLSLYIPMQNAQTHWHPWFNCGSHRTKANFLNFSQCESIFTVKLSHLRFYSFFEKRDIGAAMFQLFFLSCCLPQAKQLAARQQIKDAQYSAWQLLFCADMRGIPCMERSPRARPLQSGIKGLGYPTNLFHLQGAYPPTPGGLTHRQVSCIPLFPWDAV